MNKQDVLDLEQDLQQYICKHKLHKLFSSMLKELMLSKPQDPATHLIKYLKKPSYSLTLIITPTQLLRNVTSKVIKGYKVIRLQDWLENCALSSTDSHLAKMGRLIQNQQPYIDLIHQIQKLLQSTNIIVQGFPQCLQHALLLQKNRVLADSIIFVNANDQQLLQTASNMTQDPKQLDLILKQISISNKALKAFYRKFHEIRYLSNNLEEVQAEMKRCFDQTARHQYPRKRSEVFIIGAPASGRTTLAMNLARRCNLVNVSSSALLADQIRIDSVIGRKIKGQFENNQLIDSATVEKLIDDRIKRKDCCMQGYVLEGYPKNIEQLQNVNDSIHPTLILGIDLNQQISLSRTKNRETHTRRYQNWSNFRQQIIESGVKVLWLNPALSPQNMVQQVTYELIDII